jgi:hypothetical protein
LFGVAGHFGDVADVRSGGIHLSHNKIKGAALAYLDTTALTYLNTAPLSIAKGLSLVVFGYLTAKGKMGKLSVLLYVTYSLSCL